MNSGAELKKVELLFTNLETLYRSYMKFVVNGGIFFFTNELFTMDDQVFLNLNIAIGTVKKQYPITAEVVWKSTIIRQNGVGVAFGTDDVSLEAKKDIEELLVPFVNSDIKTFTM